jgi:hypothetical protein
MGEAESFEDIIWNNFHVEPPEDYAQRLVEWETDGLEPNLPSTENSVRRSAALGAPAGDGLGRSRGYLGLLTHEFILKMSQFCMLEPVEIGGQMRQGYKLRFAAWDLEGRPHAFHAFVAFSGEGVAEMLVVAEKGWHIDDRSLFVSMYAAMHGELLQAAFEATGGKAPDVAA